MSKRAVKAVLFDVGGVIRSPPPSGVAGYAESIGLPRNFLTDVIQRGAPDNAFFKMERGELTTTEFAVEFRKEVDKALKEANLTMPEEFDAFKMVMTITDNKAVPSVLQAMTTLRKNGLKVGVLTNNYISDIPNRKPNSNFIMALRHFADHIVESCRAGVRKPAPEIYKMACDALGVAPSETVFLDDSEENLKPAREMGIHTIKVSDPTTALKELQEVTQVNVFEEQTPPAANPDTVCHSYITTKENHRIHFVDMGDGPAVICCHGFPESWFSWRYQIPALAVAGYRVIVPDMRGYGDSSSPPDIEEFTLEKLCKDLVDLMDILCISDATLVGHDWGGGVVWHMGLFYPDRLRGIASLNTPFFPIDPNTDQLATLLGDDPGIFDYQLYFQDVGAAEAEFEKDLDRTLKVILRVSDPTERDEKYASKDPPSTSNVRARGGLLVGYPEKPPCPVNMTQADIDYCVQQFKKNGFRGPLNWYRNNDANWKWNRKVHARKITVPSLMVTATHDPVLTPETSKPMDDWVPNLTRANLDTGHWTQREKPREVNQILIDWLDKVHHKSVDRLISNI
ncbi:bifunctional epoxide hydrolase 2-like [Ptychodera flava]|uniref:bifunctional epoxide hydrolase 2-like n=1 Tax=Ptychodera flava TaxID=63121 RepID=UPI00396A62AB